MNRIFMIIFLLSCGKISAQIDRVAPQIQLIGDTAVYVCQYQAYLDSGYDATDNYDAQWQLTITKETDFINTDSAGTYKLRYKATDRAKNFRYSAYRTIYVIDKNDAACKSGNYNSVTGMPNDPGFNKIQLSAYPNPAQNELFIETNQFINTISIYNIAGQKMYQQTVDQNLYLPDKIDTKHFPAGIYMVQLKNTSGMVTKKIEIRR